MKLTVEMVREAVALLESNNMKGPHCMVLARPLVEAIEMIAAGVPLSLLIGGHLEFDRFVGGVIVDDALTAARMLGEDIFEI